MGGQPCVRGMRMRVKDVLEYLASGMSDREILDDFPYLNAGRPEGMPGVGAAREVVR